MKRQKTQAMAKMHEPVDGQADTPQQAQAPGETMLAQEAATLGNPKAFPIAHAFTSESTRLALHPREQLSLLAATLESLPDGILIVGLPGEKQTYNGKLAEMWRLPALASRNSPLSHMANLTREPRNFLATMRGIISRRQAESFDVLELRDGRIVEIHAARLRIDGTRIATVLSFRDVTEIKLAEARLRHDATHDPLTGLPNRALLLDRGERAIAQAQRHSKRAAFLFIDLNGFKRINDAAGHDVGDRVLFETARRLLRGVRREDTVARLGGDEFVVLLPEVTVGEDAAAVAIKVLQTLSNPFIVSGRPFFACASIGISLFPDHGGDTKTLLACADRAMYRAKKAGRASDRTFRFATNSAATPNRDDPRSNQAF